MIGGQNIDYRTQEVVCRFRTRYYSCPLRQSFLVPVPATSVDLIKRRPKTKSTGTLSFKWHDGSHMQWKVSKTRSYRSKWTIVVPVIVVEIEEKTTMKKWMGPGVK